MEKKRLTTAAGRPYTEFENSMTVGSRGPVLIQDYFLHEDLAHFNRERIPERISGSGYGESNLVNNCSGENNVAMVCSEEEHQLNRRTEFIIVAR